MVKEKQRFQSNPINFAIAKARLANEKVSCAFSVYFVNRGAGEIVICMGLLCLLFYLLCFIYGVGTVGSLSYEMLRSTKIVNLEKPGKEITLSTIMSKVVLRRFLKGTA